MFGQSSKLVPKSDFLPPARSTVLQDVVKATSQSNGKAKFSSPGAPKPLNGKLGIYNRVAGMPTHANACGAATTWVVWANT